MRRGKTELEIDDDEVPEIIKVLLEKHKQNVNDNKLDGFIHDCRLSEASGLGEYSDGAFYVGSYYSGYIILSCRKMETGVINITPDGGFELQQIMKDERKIWR